MTDELLPIPAAVFSSEDFTIFFGPKAEAKTSLVRWLVREKGELSLPHDIESPIRIVDTDTGVVISGRALICRSGEGGGPDDAVWSVTVRRSGKLSESDKAKLHPVPNLGVSRQLQSNWAASNEASSDFLSSRLELVDAIAENVWREARIKQTCAQGLLAVFGATASGKNWVSRGLIHRYLTSDTTTNYYTKIKKRRPHLLTYEDPIEEPFWAEASLENGLDYTPRQKDVTADLLETVLKSALRQTPAVLYVSETRDSTEWGKILRFAGTGHLITTTAHASSLTESIGFLLSALEAGTPAARRNVADRLVAVVHLRADRIRARHIDGVERIVTVLLPAIWLGTPNGKHNMMALGRGSVLPAADYCLGRYGFAKDLINRATSRKDSSKIIIEDEEREQFLNRILQMDLEGV
jgi:hypothetical protein